MTTTTDNPDEIEERRREIGERFIQTVIEEQEGIIRDLESRSKKLSDLVFSERFTVDDVVGESHATSFTPDSEARYDGYSPVYDGGFTSKLALKVTADNKVVPVTTLKFDGISAVRAGDYISAKIPRYREERANGPSPCYGCYGTERLFYVDRDFKPEESAIELTILSRDGEVLRRDRAVNYKEFIKE